MSEEDLDPLGSVARSTLHFFGWQTVPVLCVLKAKYKR